MTTTRLEFTTQKKVREERPIPVDLCGHELTLHRPKDATIYFAGQVGAETASDGDRAMAIIQFLEGVLDPTTRKAFWDWAIAGDINLSAVMDMVGSALNRWEHWDPTNTETITVDFTPSPWQPDPIEVLNEDLGLRWMCTPPSDLIVACVAASLATGANIGQQSWGIGIFLDAALSAADGLIVAQRLRNRDDDLEIEDVAAIVTSLLQEWRPPSNRRERREQAKKPAAASTTTRSRAGTTRGTGAKKTVVKKPAARRTAR